MKTKKIDLELRAANPFALRRLTGLDLGAAEAALGAALVAESVLPGGPEVADAASRRHSWRPRRVLLALAGAMAVGVAVTIVLLSGGGATESPTRAYGAELVRFAQSTPLLLLQGPGWRVLNVEEKSNGEGTMEFVPGKPIPLRQREAGMFPAAVRQGRVELSWHDRFSLRRWLRFWKWRADGVAIGKWTTVPVLGTTAYVNTRAEAYVRGNRFMKAIWREDGYVLEMNAAVPDLAALRQRFGWLHKVDSRTWLDAMPANVVKAANHEAAVREILAGLPLPPGFDPSKIPNPGLTTSRYQVGALVGGTVACGWFSRWGEALHQGDAGAAKEAERVLKAAGRWPIFKEMSKGGAYPAVVDEYAYAMPSRRWYGRPLLPEVDQGLGCSAKGFPLRAGWRSGGG